MKEIRDIINAFDESQKLGKQTALAGVPKDAGVFPATVVVKVHYVEVAAAIHGHPNRMH